MQEQLHSYQEMPSGTEYLDPADPIDNLLVTYRQQAANEELPTPAQQKQLIAGVRQNDVVAARTLLQTHRGLVAAVAYPYKGYGVSSEELLVKGGKALLKAAKTYDRNYELDFSDYLINVVRSSLSPQPSEEVASENGSSPTDEAPMESLLRFVTGLRIGNARTIQESRQKKMQMELSRLTAVETRSLDYIHLPIAEGVKESGLTSTQLVRHTAEARKKFGLRSREELAELLFEAGVQPTVNRPKNIKKLSIRNRQVATRLAMRNPEIAKELALTEKQVTRSVMRLLRLTEARTRTELLLMAKAYKFEPSEKELIDTTPDAIKEFSPFQRPILKLLYLSSEEIGKHLGYSAPTISSSISRVLRKTGCRSRTALALELQARGMEFDIRAPKRPLAEIFTEQEIRVGRSLGLSDEDIEVNEGYPKSRVGGMTTYMRLKSGARTRTELALMVSSYDTGQSKPIYHNIRPREERFFEALDIEPLPDDQARLLLEHATPRQTDYLDAYYFSEKQVSWRAIGERLGVTRENAIQIANRGLARIKEKLSEEQTLIEDELIDSTKPR